LLFHRTDSNHFVFQRSGKHGAPHASLTLDEISLWHDCENVVLNKSSKIMWLFGDVLLHFRHHCSLFGRIFNIDAKAVLTWKLTKSSAPHRPAVGITITASHTLAREPKWPSIPPFLSLLI